jgi:type IV pilus assembly protein PilF
VARGILISLVVATALLSACTSTTTRPTLDPKEEKEASFHYQLGANFFAEKMVPQALRELLLTIEIDPNHPDALHLLAFVYQGRHDFGQAIIYYKRAVKARDNFYIAQNNLGTALMASGRYGEAAELFETLSAKPMYNTPELAYNNLGWSYFKLGDHLRAEESIKMALFLQPELCLAHNNLGVVMESRGDRVGARRAWEKAVRKCPHYAEPHFHVGMMLHTRRDPKAATWFRRCYEVAPESNWGDRCRSYLEIYPE